MFNFNSKSDRIEDLEWEIRSKDREIEELKRVIDNNEVKFKEIERLTNSAPEGCVSGPWCKACQFVRVFHTKSFESLYLNSIYCCGKGESCKHFIPQVNDNVEAD